MTPRHAKCDRCPLAGEDGICNGQITRRACSGQPGLFRKALNLAGAVAEHVAAGMPTASDEVKAARLAICRANTCGFYGEGDRCLHSACGCYLAVKTGWADQACPIGLWGPVPTSPQADPVAPEGTDSSRPPH